MWPGRLADPGLQTNAHSTALPGPGKLNGKFLVLSASTGEVEGRKLSFLSVNHIYDCGCVIKFIYTIRACTLLFYCIFNNTHLQNGYLQVDKYTASERFQF